MCFGFDVNKSFEKMLGGRKCFVLHNLIRVIVDTFESGTTFTRRLFNIIPTYFLMKSLSQNFHTLNWSRFTQFPKPQMESSKYGGLT